MLFKRLVNAARNLAVLFGFGNGAAEGRVSSCSFSAGKLKSFTPTDRVGSTNFGASCTVGNILHYCS